MTATRIVRHLRLRGRHADGIRQAVPLLEDALRTASLPDAEGGRIVVVRRLALGAIDPRAAPQRLALALERGVARLGAMCTHATDNAALSAPVVWFASALEAHTLLAERLAAGESVDAWFWPLAVDVWRPRQPVAEALRRLAFSLAALPEAATALPHWTAALIRAGHGQRLAEAIRDEDVAPLARAAGLHWASQHAAPSAPATAPFVPLAGSVPVVPAKAGQAQQALLRALLQAAGVVLPGLPARNKAAWDTPQSLAPHADSTVPNVRRTSASNGGAERHEMPGRHPLPAVPVAGMATEPKSPQRPQELIGRQRSALPPASAAPAELQSGEQRSGERRTGEQSLPRSALPVAHDHGRSSEAAAMLAQRTGDRRPGEQSLPRSALPAAHDHGRNAEAAAVLAMSHQPTTLAGGLLFLIPVLVRLGYLQWIEAEPRWARWQIAQRLFAAVLARLGVGADDPVWHLAESTAPRGAPPGRFVAPPCWRDGLCAGSGKLLLSQCVDGGRLHDPSRRLLLAVWRGARPRVLLPLLRGARPGPAIAPEGELLDLVTTAWLTACRRWLRRYTGLGLADLVGRPAGLGLTATHADCHFAHDQADIRLRRAGLDLDPGWVPWLGRVVGFHYDSRNGR